MDRPEQQPKQSPMGKDQPHKEFIIKLTFKKQQQSPEAAPPTTVIAATGNDQQQEQAKATDDVTPAADVIMNEAPASSPVNQVAAEVVQPSTTEQVRVSPVKEEQKEMGSVEEKTEEKPLSESEKKRKREEELKQEAKKNCKRGETPVYNDPVLVKIPEKERYLGHLIYSGCKAHHDQVDLFLLPRFSAVDFYSLVQVRIPSEFLSMKNLAVQNTAVWGTDVYTDDSDVVAGEYLMLMVACIHSGFYLPFDAQIANDNKENYEEKTSDEWKRPAQPVYGTTEDNRSADHDLIVTLRILPKLTNYGPCKRYGITSRGWGKSHDGHSYRVESIRKVEKGSVERGIRKKGVNKWFNMAKIVAQEMMNIEKEIQETSDQPKNSLGMLPGKSYTEMYTGTVRT